MKIRLALAAALAASAIALTGCTITKTPHAEPAPAVETPAADPAPATGDTSKIAFDLLMTSDFGADAVPAAEQVATSFCDLLDATGDYDSAVRAELSLALDNGVTSEQLGKIIGAGVPAFCPEHADEAAAWNAAHSG